jgi:hypothetical protein
MIDKGVVKTKLSGESKQRLWAINFLRLVKNRSSELKSVSIRSSTTCLTLDWRDVKSEREKNKDSDSDGCEARHRKRQTEPARDRNGDRFAVSQSKW